ncbi:hypothetical protein G5B38_15955 [Pseudohalocynthiibacter aestuariivivens]|uniref:YcxB-like protein n=1 Tax=Roseovarius pelagicus TaxID=2980108 RepID=A0ABY6DLB3_9RHOB|nr:MULTISPECIES: hypothetical protein [Rhodobacterales]QIE46894.1 hypothetical protein G5B38_15955 [Pseudohalocynthiibacter aestuariivivens]UXX84560.1 hypothetical protein N7U68_07950 [Roseovarius pelagicus]
MSARQVTVRYTLTEDWEKEMRNYRKNMGWDAWLIRCLASIATATFALLVGWFGAVSVSRYFGLGFGAETSLGIVGAILGFSALYLINQRVNRRMGLGERDIFGVGSEVIYDFDAAGFRMVTYAQDWRTPWTVVHDISMTDRAVIFRTPFFVSVVPISEVPEPRDETLARLRAWRDDARRAR